MSLFSCLPISYNGRVVITHGHCAYRCVMKANAATLDMPGSYAAMVWSCEVERACWSLHVTMHSGTAYPLHLNQPDCQLYHVWRQDDMLSS